MVLTSGERAVQVPLPGELTGPAMERSLKAALKRFSRGFLKTVALMAPQGPPPGLPMMAGAGDQYRILRQVLEEEYTVLDTQLDTGQVPADADLLLLADPRDLDEKQVFAVDQFLMRGGTLIAAASPIKVEMSGRLSASRQKSGLEKWLDHQGLRVEEKLILDPQNTPFPVPVERQLAGFTVRETRLVNYPFFIDIRDQGLPRDHGLTAGLDQITATWASPITVDEQKNKKRRVTRLLRSSPGSWTTDDLNIQPDFRRFGEMGFARGESTGSSLIGVMVEGGFTSLFAGRESPLLTAARKAAEEKKKKKETQKHDTKATEKPKDEPPVIGRVIEHSPDSARIILISSPTFASDTTLSLISSTLGTEYLNPVTLLNNGVDWSLEDRDLLAIRGRSHFARTLPPMSHERRLFWEYLNYGLAAAGLLLLWLVRARIRHGRTRRWRALLQQQGGQP